MASSRSVVPFLCAALASRGLVVTDFRRERGDQHQRLLHQYSDPRRVGANPGDAAIGEGIRSIGQEPDRLEHGIDDDRLKHVELEMTLARGDSDSGLIAEHAAAHHGQRLDPGWIDLVRHDRGAGFVLRQDQFAEPRTRAGTEQADVVCDLEQISGGASSAPCANTRAPCDASASNLFGALTKADRSCGRRLWRTAWRNGDRH